MRLSEVERRYLEVELKFRFNTCSEADEFFDGTWTHCPVCGGDIVNAPFVYDEDYLVFQHKDIEGMKV